MRGTSRYDEAQFQKRLWTPANEPLRVTRWFDAGDVTTLTLDSSNRCSQWNDKSQAGANATQATTSAMPTQTYTSVFAPFPALNFSAASLQQMDYTVMSVGDMTLVCLVQRNTFTTNHRTIVSGQSATSFQARLNTSHQLELLSAGVSSLLTSGTVPVGAALLAGQTNTTGKVGRVNGTETTAATAVTFTNGTGRIGANYGVGEEFDGAMAELVMFQGVLSRAQIHRVEGYLAWKWGVQRLLLRGHPFALRPPLIGD